MLINLLIVTSPVTKIQWIFLNTVSSTKIYDRNSKSLLKDCNYLLLVNSYFCYKLSFLKSLDYTRTAFPIFLFFSSFLCVCVFLFYFVLFFCGSRQGRTPWEKTQKTTNEVLEILKHVNVTIKFKVRCMSAKLKVWAWWPEWKRSSL